MFSQHQSRHSRSLQDFRRRKTALPTSQARNTSRRTNFFTTSASDSRSTRKNPRDRKGIWTSLCGMMQEAPQVFFIGGLCLCSKLCQATSGIVRQSCAHAELYFRASQPLVSTRGLRQASGASNMGRYQFSALHVHAASYGVVEWRSRRNPYPPTGSDRARDPVPRRRRHRTQERCTPLAFRGCGKHDRPVS